MPLKETPNSPSKSFFVLASKQLPQSWLISKALEVLVDNGSPCLATPDLEFSRCKLRHPPEKSWADVSQGP